MYILSKTWPAIVLQRQTNSFRVFHALYTAAHYYNEHANTVYAVELEHINHKLLN